MTDLIPFFVPWLAGLLLAMERLRKATQGRI